MNEPVSLGLLHRFVHRRLLDSRRRVVVLAGNWRGHSLGARSNFCQSGCRGCCLWQNWSLYWSGWPWWRLRILILRTTGLAGTWPLFVVEVGPNVVDKAVRPSAFVRTKHDL